MKLGIAILIIVLAGAGFYFALKDKPMPSSEIEKIKGLEITVIKDGSGEEAQNGDMLSVNYTGMFEDGKKFDSNVDPAFGHVEPFSFVLGQGMIIKGWDLGLLGMKTGEKRKLVISPELAYGSSGFGQIPPNSTLVFEVEVLGIQKSGK
jgi:FKBP-type peptidyl-prolyl cis-trans isomerase